MAPPILPLPGGGPGGQTAPNPMRTGQPPLGAGPLGLPGANPGNTAAAMQKIAQAVDILNKAISELGPGSEEHSKVLNAVKSLSSVAGPGATNANQNKQQLRQLMADQTKNSALEHLMRQGTGQTGAPAGGPLGAQPGGIGAQGAPFGGMPAPGL